MNKGGVRFGYPSKQRIKSGTSRNAICRKGWVFCPPLCYVLKWIFYGIVFHNSAADIAQINAVYLKNETLFSINRQFLISATRNMQELKVKKVQKTLTNILSLVLLKICVIFDKIKSRSKR